MTLVDGYWCPSIVVERDMASVVFVKKFYPETLLFSRDELQSGEMEQPTFYQVKDEIDGYFLNFPVVLDSEQNPWTLGNLYLMHYALTCSAGDYHHTTMASEAYALRDYLDFLEENEIDPLNIPRSERRQPVKRFEAEMLRRSDDPEFKCSKSTAKDRVQKINGLYNRFLVPKGIAKTPDGNALHGEKDAYMYFMNRYGKISRKPYKSNNLNRIKVGKPKRAAGDTITDGGSLIPLTLDEQKILWKALERSDYVYLLMFLLAVNTGARLQTVTTIRVKHIKNVEDFDLFDCAHIAYGGGSEIDGKGGREGEIQVARWLINLLKVYADSPTAKKRRAKTDLGDTDENYLFLSRTGSAFYSSRKEMDDHRSLDADRRMSRKDALSDDFNPDEGKKIQVFINQVLLPRIWAEHPDFPNFSFHDLRATAGMNLLETMYAVITQTNVERRKKGEPELPFEYAKEVVREMLCHSSPEVTEGYIRYRDTSHWKKQLINDFADQLYGHITLPEGQTIDQLKVEIGTQLQRLKFKEQEFTQETLSQEYELPDDEVLNHE